MTLRPEQLTGFELQKAKRTIGKPLMEALQASDEMAFYALVWLSECRENGDVPFDDVLARPFGDVMEAFDGMDDEDPTSAGSGQS